MEGRATARILQDRTNAIIVFNKQIAGGRSHENLDPGSARQALQFSNVVCIVARTTDPESEIAMHAMAATTNLVFQRLGGSGERLGVRHLEHGGHPTQHGCE